MADAVTYVIHIKGDGAGGRASASSNGIAPSTNGQSVTSSQISGKSTSTPISGKGIGSNILAISKGAVLAAANKGITTYINRVSLQSGNNALQERMAYTYSAAQRAICIGGALVGGIATGNPLAVIGAAASAVSWGIDIGIQAENINLQREVESISIRQANIRAGAGGDRIGRNTY